MNRSDILRMMSEAGAGPNHLRPKTYSGIVEVFCRFAALVITDFLQRNGQCRDDIVSMAREAGVADGIELPHEIAAIERFAALVTAAEREGCAKVCDAIEIDRWALYKGRSPYTGTELGRADPNTQGMSDGATMCADAIRARGTL